MMREVFERESAADDRAFYLQRAFRALLDAMARPGEVTELAARAQGDVADAGASGLPESALVLADVVLDAATSVAVAGPVGDDAATVLARRTHVAMRDAQTAAFGFVPASVRGQQARAFVAALSAGTLLDPQLGATCIVVCDTLLGSDRDGCLTGARAGGADVSSWELSGPGIRETARIELDRTEIVEARLERGDEFPCGIDLVFVDAAGHVLCLPRTTRVRRLDEAAREEGGAAWGM